MRIPARRSMARSARESVRHRSWYSLARWLTERNRRLRSVFFHVRPIWYHRSQGMDERMTAGAAAGPDQYTIVWRYSHGCQVYHRAGRRDPARSAAGAHIVQHDQVRLAVGDRAD